MDVIAVLILVAHLIWIALVIFGAFWTRGRPVWSLLHILALVWGIVVEVGSWPCPLTLAEQFFEARAGASLYQGSFLLHYLDALVYPNLPIWVVSAAGVGICAINLWDLLLAVPKSPQVLSRPARRLTSSQTLT